MLNNCWGQQFFSYFGDSDSNLDTVALSSLEFELELGYSGPDWKVSSGPSTLFLFRLGSPEENIEDSVICRSSLFRFGTLKYKNFGITRE